ncbi:AsmA-like C-terminal region-containing protein [Aliiroseovarius sp. F47248L]|uniref:AsmA-like C-terminal region-containing protein n=1 Tax=Aliiroseovarius sp. F47248L TaxID=2926420 RepID=UPI001FF40809|nr:AsmA-like C-terminal region-containing protein [Aliiroseovarius sp. F47248L]MCK0138553.1 AsmA-like C-terminal region-containing protein [Aliiroseovarius sp. F47248L]
MNNDDKPTRQEDAEDARPVCDGDVLSTHDKPTKQDAGDDVSGDGADPESNAGVEKAVAKAIAEDGDADDALDKNASEDAGTADAIVAPSALVATARFPRWRKTKGAEEPEVTPEMRARRRKRLKWHFGIWSFVLIALAALFLALVSMSVTGHVFVLPKWATEQIEEKINSQTNRVKLSLSQVELGVTRLGLPRLRLVDLGVRDETGLEIGRLNAVEGSLLLGPVLSGRVEPATLSLRGAQITVRRSRDGSFDLSLGQGIGASGDLASVLDRIDAVFTTGILSNSERISATNLTITLEDARTGRLWQVTDGALSISQTEQAVDMTLSFDVFNQTEELAETVLGFRSVKGSSSARLTATFKNARARDIAAQTPLLTFLGLVDAPISGALRTVIDDTGQVSGLAGTLEFGAGNLSPDPAAKPVKFTGGKVYLDYDPERERMNFAQASLQSDWGEIQADGHSYLRGWAGGWPTELLGQLNVTHARISPPDVFESPLLLGQGSADFRLNLSPFRVDVGQFAITHDDTLATGSARIGIGSEGWSVAIDAAADHVSPEQVTAFWPLANGARTRIWARDNVTKGRFTDVNVAWRKEQGRSAHTALSAAFEGVTVRAVKEMVPIENASGQFTIDGRRLVVTADQGVLRPLDRNGNVAGVLDAAGTSFVIPQMARRPEDPDAPRPPVPAWVDLSVSGPLKAALHLLDDKPFRIFRDTPDGAIGPDMAGGRVTLGGRIDIAMQPKVPRSAIDYRLAGTLSAIKSDTIVNGRLLELPFADLVVGTEGVSISGQGRFSGVPVKGTWAQSFGGGTTSGRSTVTGEMTLDQAFLDAFSIGLPADSVTGSTTANYTVSLARGEAPRITLDAPLDGVGLSIAALGWSKSKGSKGALSLSGKLGSAPVIEELSLRAPGLDANGSVIMSEGGGLVAAQFDRVTLGGWLDAPVTLTGRGPGKPVSVTVKGGIVDMRKTTLGSGKGGGTGGQPVPISLLLDKLIISEGITITGFDGDFTQTGGGLNGTFQGQIGAGPTIRGTAAPQPKGTAFRITSKDAGGVLRASGVLKSARKGDMELILAPGGSKGVYDGDLKIKNIDVHDAPAMAELLSAISVVGLLQQLGGQGIPFTNVDARFRLDPDKVTIYEGAATGHSMGISMDGYYFLGSGQMDMQGVISPFYLVNSAGRIFARKGEGLVGFNYTLKGTASDPKVGVNPLSLFTPGFFRDIFRRNPPPRPQAE